MVELDQALPGGRARMQMVELECKLIKLYHMVELESIVKLLPYDRARMLSSLALVCHEVKMLESLALVVEL